MFLIDLCWYCICLDWLSGALVGVGGSDFIGQPGAIIITTIIVINIITTIITIICYSIITISRLHRFDVPPQVDASVSISHSKHLTNTYGRFP